MKILKKPLWITLTAVFAVLLAALIVGGVIANSLQRTINSYFQLPNYRTETVATDEWRDSEYYKSDYVQKNADGNITLKLNSTAAVKADFILCIGRQSAEYKFNATHTLTVNGEQATIADDVVIESTTVNQWLDWKEYTIAEIELKAGENIIVLSNNSANPGADNSAPSGNMDYFTLRVYDAAAELTQLDAITPVQ